MNYQRFIDAFIIAYCLFSLTCCQTKSDTPEPVVYIAGQVETGDISIPCFWKNGIRNDLSVLNENGRGQGNSICVSGNDVFIAGWTRNNLVDSVPCFWKNGIRTDLDLRLKTKNADAGWAESVFISNGDVYVAGTNLMEIDDWDSNIVPCFWKNEARTDLGMISETEELDAAQANSIFVSEGDIYAAGSTYLKGEGDTYFPCYWKNGIRTDLTAQKETERTGDSYAYSIFVSENDVYIAGQINSWSTSLGNRWFPCFWKNGVRTDLSLITPSKKEYGYAGSIFVSGNDVYVAGATNGLLSSIPCYWKNDVRVDLSVLDEAEGGVGNSIYVSGSDIFIAGASIIARTNNSITYLPCYWKNGIRTDLAVADASKGGSAKSIFIAVSN